METTNPNCCSVQPVPKLAATNASVREWHTHDDGPDTIRLGLVRSQCVNDDANHANNGGHDQDDERVFRYVGAIASFCEPDIGLIA